MQHSEESERWVRRGDTYIQKKRNARHIVHVRFRGISSRETLLVLRRRWRRIICRRHVNHTQPTRQSHTHHKPHTVHSNISLPVPAQARLGTAHRRSPSAETTYNRSKTEDTVPRSSTHTHPAHRPRPPPQNARSAATDRVGMAPGCEVGVARRSNPCCTFGARRTLTTSPGTTRTSSRPRAMGSTRKSGPPVTAALVKNHPAAQALPPASSG